jgi:hypothetical protein
MRFLTFLLANGDANFTLHAEMNWRVLGVAAAISLLTGVLFGLAPALQSTRVDVIPALKEAQTGQAAGRRSLFRVNLSQALVTVQIALSLLMLIAAGLFVRTLANLQSVELGFNRENVLLLSINAREAGHKGADLLAFYGDLLKRLREIPGVRDAGFSDSSLIGAGFGLDIKVPGITNHPDTRIMSVGPGFFQTMQIAFLTGRAPDERDRPGTPAVAVINEMFAKHYFPDQNPLGRHLVLGTAAEYSRHGGGRRDAQCALWPLDR